MPLFSASFRHPFVFVLLLAGACPALAQEEAANGPDAIEAIAYRPIESGAALLIQPETQSEMDDEAFRLVSELMAANGYRADDSADLVLTIATQLVGRSGDAGEAGVAGESNVYNSEGQSLLNPLPPPTTSDRIFRVYLSVHDRTSGGYVWRGIIERGSAERDPTAALPTMLPELLAHFGLSYSTK
jgi:hypothetical protein